MRWGLGSRRTRPPAELPAVVARVAAELTPSRVVVLVDAADIEPLPVDPSWFAGAEVTVLATGALKGQRFDVGVPVVGVVRPRGVHLAMAEREPVDLVVDLCRDAGARYRHLRWLLGHVRPGGAYVVPGAAETDDVHRLARILQAVLEDPERTDASSADRDLALAVASVEVDGGDVVLRRRGELAVKVRHPELERLARQAAWTRVLDEQPPVEVDTSAVVGTTNDDELRAVRFPDRLDVPGLRTRELHDVVAHPGGVLTRGRLVLPDTFRLWRIGTLSSYRLQDVAEFFVQQPEEPDPLPVLEGQHYYLDHEFPTHFGHVMTEVLGRLWAWPAALERNPDLRLLVSGLAPYQEELYAALGIARDQITVIDGPTRVTSLVSPMPAFHIGSFAHPDLLRPTYERLQAGIPEATSPAVTPEKVFLSRDPGLWRGCVNADELEGFFTDRGFAVVRPEQHDLATQAALFRGARVVAGCTGSQLYGQVFSPTPLDVIAFVSPAYTSNNEFLLAASLGHTLHQVWCPEADSGRREDVTGRAIVPMHQDFRFDVDRDGPALAALLDRV